MIVGKVAYWMSALGKGQCVNVNIDDMTNSAKSYLLSGFDTVRQDDIDLVVSEIIFVFLFCCR